MKSLVRSSFLFSVFLFLGCGSGGGGDGETNEVASFEESRFAGTWDFTTMEGDNDDLEDIYYVVIREDSTGALYDLRGDEWDRVDRWPDAPDCFEKDEVRFVLQENGYYRIMGEFGGTYLYEVKPYTAEEIDFLLYETIEMKLPKVDLTEEDFAVNICDEESLRRF